MQLTSRLWLILTSLTLIVLILIFVPIVGKTRSIQLESSYPQAKWPLKFPPTFIWGTAVASQQTDHQAPSDWSAFENRARKEGLTKHSDTPGVAIPGHIAGLNNYPQRVLYQKTDFNTRYPTDFKRMREMGLNSFRFSFAWSKLFPRAGMQRPDPAAIRYYKNILKELEKNNLKASATLFHFSSPQWFWQPKDGKRGWERDDAVALFSQYVKAVVENFGDQIEFWCTLNEPMVYVYNGYMTGTFPPLEQRQSPAELALVVENLLRAHASAYHILHDYARKNDMNYLVGITKHTRAFEPLRNWSVLDRLGADGVEQAFIWDFQDAMQSGQLKITGTDVDKLIPNLAGSYDYTGINYYGRFYVEGKISDPFNPIIHMNDPNSNEPVNDLGWAIYPQGFYKIMKQTYDRYKKDIYILENGTADCKQNDMTRKYFLVSHVREIHKARQDGIPVKAYYHWTFTDNFEWAEGFEACFGLHQTMYKQNFKRQSRASASLYSWIINQGLQQKTWDEYRKNN